MNSHCYQCIKKHNIGQFHKVAKCGLNIQTDQNEQKCIQTSDGYICITEND